MQGRRGSIELQIKRGVFVVSRILTNSAALFSLFYLIVCWLYMIYSCPVMNWPLVHFHPKKAGIDSSTPTPPPHPRDPQCRIRGDRKLEIYLSQVLAAD